MKREIGLRRTTMLTAPGAGVVIARPAGWTACDGRGLCAELLPELLVEDDRGLPAARGSLDVPEGRETAAGRAVDRYPALALRLVPSQQS